MQNDKGDPAMDNLISQLNAMRKRIEALMESL
jgi:hypothetical protein